MINILIWVIIGGIVGWLASLIMRTDAQQGILMNIVVGIVGAFLGGLIFSGGDINRGAAGRHYVIPHCAARRGHPPGDREPRSPQEHPLN